MAFFAIKEERGKTPNNWGKQRKGAKLPPERQPPPVKAQTAPLPGKTGWEGTLGQQQILLSTTGRRKEKKWKFFVPCCACYRCPSQKKTQELVVKKPGRPPGRGDGSEKWRPREKQPSVFFFQKLGSSNVKEKPRKGTESR